MGTGVTISPAVDARPRPARTGENANLTGEIPPKTSVALFQAQPTLLTAGALTGLLRATASAASANARTLAGRPLPKGAAPTPEAALAREREAVEIRQTLDALRGQSRVLSALANNVVRATGAGAVHMDTRTRSDVQAGHPAWLAIRKGRARVRAQAHRAAAAASRAAHRLSLESAWALAYDTVAGADPRGPRGLTRRARQAFTEEGDIPLEPPTPRCCEKPSWAKSTTRWRSAWRSRQSLIKATARPKSMARKRPREADEAEQAEEAD